MSGVERRSCKLGPIDERVEAAVKAAGRDRWRPGLHGINPNQSYYAR